jgi:hypothetical protein
VTLCTKSGALLAEQQEAQEEGPPTAHRLRGTATTTLKTSAPASSPAAANATQCCTTCSAGAVQCSALAGVCIWKSVRGAACVDVHSDPQGGFYYVYGPLRCCAKAAGNTTAACNWFC